MKGNVLRFSKKINLNFYELDAPSIHIYKKGLCNMNCMGCFNMGDLFQYEESDIDIKGVLKYIQPQVDLFEYIVFTGGEILTAPVELLIETLTLTRNQFPTKKIILYTNGLDYSKLAAVVRIVDGVHMDIKLPYHLLIEEDMELVQHILGRKLNARNLTNLTKSIELIIKCDKGYSQLRTVKYPGTDEDIWAQNQILIEELNKKYNKHTPYHLNTYIPKE